MGGERRRGSAGSVNVQQRDPISGPRQRTGPRLSPSCQNQTGLCQLGERFSNKSGIGIHAVCKEPRRDLLTFPIAKHDHDVRGNGKLDIFERHSFQLPLIMMLISTFSYSYIRRFFNRNVEARSRVRPPKTS